MRYIKKEKTLPQLTIWIAVNRTLPNFNYKSLPSSVRNEIKNTLLQEQGYICAYTGLKIVTERSHIEHMITQENCRRSSRPELTVDYRNVVACFPGNKAPEPPFGARYKGDWPLLQEEEHLLLKPTDPSCESRIKYLVDGRVEAMNSNDDVAKTTIEKLNLSEASLANRRKEAIVNLFSSTYGRKPTRQSLRNRLQNLDARNDGELEEFCFAKKQCLERKISSWQ